MNRGAFDQFVTFERATVTTDEYGQNVETWAPYATAWARVLYGRGDERRQAAIEQGQQAVTFVVIANTETRAVTVRDRIEHDGSGYDIVGIAPMNRAEIEFTGVRAL